MPSDIGSALTGQGYNTELPLADEWEFRNWLKENQVPFDPEAKATDYDMRGYWQGLRQQSPHARPTEVNPNDNSPHYTDYYKTPLHESFSSGSKFAGPDTPSWNRQDQLVDPTGKILFDEKFNKLLRR